MQPVNEMLPVTCYDLARLSPVDNNWASMNYNMKVSDRRWNRRAARWDLLSREDLYDLMRGRELVVKRAKKLIKANAKFCPVITMFALAEDTQKPF